MLLKETVQNVVEQYLSTTDYYLVDIKVTPDSRVLIEIDSFDGVSLDFCAALNRHIESQFDREVEDYELEVSSAGLTEPFKVVKQYQKNIGNEVEVLTRDGKKLSGELLEADEQAFVVGVEKTVKPEGAKRKMTILENISFAYTDIKYTKYIIRFK